MLDPSYRQDELVAIADLVQIGSTDEALGRLKRLREEYSASFANYAGRLIDELRMRPTAMSMPHVADLVFELEAMGVNHAAPATR